MKIKIYTIESPFDDFFSTPDFYDLVEWYGPYCKASIEAGLTPADPQPFITKMCDELARLNVREGRNSQGWFTRMREHWGLSWVHESIGKMKAARAAIPFDETSRIHRG